MKKVRNKSLEEYLIKFDKEYQENPEIESKPQSEFVNEALSKFEEKYVKKMRKNM